MAACATRAGERGTATVELAFLAPLLILLGVGVADFGRVMYASMVVNNAARAGAQYALDLRYTDIAGIKAAAVQDTQTSAGVGLLTPVITTSNVAVSTTCPCPALACSSAAARARPLLPGPPGASTCSGRPLPGGSGRHSRPGYDTRAAALPRL